MNIKQQDILGRSFKISEEYYTVLEVELEKLEKKMKKNKSDHKLLTSKIQDYGKVLKTTRKIAVQLDLFPIEETVEPAPDAAPTSAPIPEPAV